MEIYEEELPVLLQWLEKEIEKVYKFIMGGTGVDCTELKFSGFPSDNYNETLCRG